jgi:hypothetical protein
VSVKLIADRIREVSMKRIAALSLSALFAAAAWASHQGNTVKGALEGVIMSNVTGEPVAGAEVRLGLFIGRPSIPPSPAFPR